VGTPFHSHHAHVARAVPRPHTIASRHRAATRAAGTSRPEPGIAKVRSAHSLPSSYAKPARRYYRPRFHGVTHACRTARVLGEHYSLIRDRSQNSRSLDERSPQRGCMPTAVALRIRRPAVSQFQERG
jgi:hypothetical protein